MPAESSSSLKDQVIGGGVSGSPCTVMNEVINLSGEEEDWMSFSFQSRADDVPDNDSDYEGTVVKVFSFIHDDFDTGQDLVSNGYRKGGLLTLQGDKFDWMFNGSLEDWGECSSRTENNGVEACDSDEYVDGMTEESEDETIEIPKPNQKNLQVDFQRSSEIGKDEHQSNAWNKLVAGLQMCHDNTEIEPINCDERKCEHQDKYQENISDNDSDEVERQNQNGPPKTPETHLTDLNNPHTEESCPEKLPVKIRDDRTGGSVDMEQAPVHQGTQTKGGDNASQRQGKSGKGTDKAEYSCYMCMFTASTVVAVVGHLQDHHKQDFPRYEVVKLFRGKSKMQRNKYGIFPSSKGMRSSHRVNIFKSKLVKTNKIFPKNKRVISNSDKFSNKTDDMVECCSVRHSSVIEENRGASMMSEPNIHTESQKHETPPHPSLLQTSSHQNVSNCSEKSTSHTAGDWSNVFPLIHNHPAEPTKNSICVRTHWERVEPPENIIHFSSHCSSISQVRDSAVEEPVDNCVCVRADGTSYLRDFEMLDSVDMCAKTGPGTEPEINPKESFLREGLQTQFKEVARELPDETVKELACFFCSFVGNNPEMLQLHNQQVHRWENLYGEESHVVTNYNVAQLKSFACWFCPFRTTLFEKFITHKVRYHPLETMCDSVNQDIAAGRSENTRSEKGISDCDSPLNSDPLSVLREPSHQKDFLNPLPVNVCLRGSSREDTDSRVPQELHCPKDILDPLPENVCLTGSLIKDSETSVPQEPYCQKDILDPLLVNGGLGGSSREDTDKRILQDHPCQKDILDPLPENVCLRGPSTEDTDKRVLQEHPCLTDILDTLSENVCLTGSLNEDTDKRILQDHPCLTDILDPLPENVCLRVPSTEDTDKRVLQEHPCLTDILDPLPENVCLRGPSTEDTDKRVPQEHPCLTDILDPLPENVCLRGSSREDSETTVPQEPHCQKDILDPSLVNGGLGGSFGKDASLDNDTGVQKTTCLLQGILTDKQRQGDVNSRGGLEECRSESVSDSYDHLYVLHQTDNKYSKMKEHLEKIKMVSENQQTPKRLKQRDRCDSSLSPEDVIELFKDINEYTQVHPIQDFASKNLPLGPRHSKLRAVKRNLFSNCQAAASKASDACIKGRFKQVLTWDSSHSQKQSCSNPKYKKQSGTGTVFLNQSIVFNGNYEKTHLGQQRALTTKKIGKNEQEIMTNTIRSHVDTENKLLKRRGRPRKNRSPEHNPDVITRADSLSLN